MESYVDKKLREIIIHTEKKPNGVKGFSGEIDGWEYNIRKKKDGYRLKILPIKETL